MRSIKLLSATRLSVTLLAILNRNQCVCMRYIATLGYTNNEPKRSAAKNCGVFAKFARTAFYLSAA